MSTRFIRVPASLLSPYGRAWGEHYVQNQAATKYRSLPEERLTFLHRQQEFLRESLLAGYTDAIYHKATRENKQGNQRYHISTVVVIATGFSLAQVKQVVEVESVHDTPRIGGITKPFGIHAEDLPTLLHGFDKWPRIDLQTLVITGQPNVPYQDGVMADDLNKMPGAIRRRAERVVPSIRERLTTAWEAFRHPERYFPRQK